MRRISHEARRVATPKWLGVLLAVGGACYLADLLAALLVPDVSRMIHAFIVIPSAVAELTMVGYLLAVGLRRSQPMDGTPAEE